MRIFGSYALVYLLDGSGIYGDGRMTTHLRTGDLILVFPDTAHYYGPSENGHWDEWFMVFDGPVFDPWRQVGLISPARPVLHLEPVSFWATRMEAICHEHSGTLAERICELQRLIASAISANETGSVVPRDIAWLNAAQREIELSAQQAGEFSSIADIAERLGESYESFRKRFSRLAGMSPAQHRTHCLMQRVCDLLQQSDLPLREIARRCGFCDEFHLSRRFRTSMGISPTQFRKQMGL